MIRTFRRLRAAGILGMNRRNADYVMEYNPRRLYPLVDDKLQTKRLLQAAGIAVPQLYGVIEFEGQTDHLEHFIGEHRDFVIKPAHGSGGDGILVLTGRYRDAYRRASGTLMERDEVVHHLSNILSGSYSLGGLPDRAMIEYRVHFDPVFTEISYQGVPDIRTLVFQGVPVASMIRLPTRSSDGKANLHQGAVGVGVDMITGHTRGGVFHERLVDEHPDTGSGLAGREIPGWEQLLELAARCYDITGLGYLGVDVVLDRDLGPLILELNARPGLSIQLACGFGLSHRLRRIERAGIPGPASERVALAREIARD